MSDLAQRAKEARTVKVELDGREFVLVAPTLFRMKAILLRHGNPDLNDRLAVMKLHRTTLAESIAGWTGVRISDVLGEEAGQDVLEFSAANAVTLFEERDDWAEALQDALMKRVGEINNRFTSAAKN